MSAVWHRVVNARKLINVSPGALEEELLIPCLLQRLGIDHFKGVENDMISAKVEGDSFLPCLAWRNGRSSRIVSTSPHARGCCRLLVLAPS
ncbi:hypothetical protein [Streptomyces avicenniae]|uniref:hypothetical protein n=1 Tax=Streptomyces avicenniae TaxID=500153 RepID=UPI00167ECA2F|nr:hypothetical protein [Streptomyces avicenniae]